jgi:hypothetical protein
VVFGKSPKPENPLVQELEIPFQAVSLPFQGIRSTSVPVAGEFKIGVPEGKFVVASQQFTQSIVLLLDSSPSSGFFCSFLNFLGLKKEKQNWYKM